VARILIVEKSKVWKVKKSKLIPTKKNKSPILFIRNAFVAALPACWRVYQKPINKYEHNPTPSQPIKSTKKLAEETSINIKKEKKDK